MPLESVVMTVKAIFGPTAPAQAVLGRAVTPPDASACRAAVGALKVSVALGTLLPNTASVQNLLDCTATNTGIIP